MGTQVNNETPFVDVGMETIAKQAADSLVNRVMNPILDEMARTCGKVKVTILNVFQEYLTNATLRYNQVKTLATGITPRKIVGTENIYVQLEVQYKNRIISTETVEPMLNLSKNILVYGTGGAGKTMLMRYLFLNTIDRGDYIPILLNLRQISNQKSKYISIIELVCSCLSDFGVVLPQDQFEYCLKKGKFLFLMDGLDEVCGAMSEETASAIQKFCAKYPKNPCIITSRPRLFHRVLETFTQVETKNLNLNQAVQLAKKLGQHDEKAWEFCQKLEEGLFDRHIDFAENPLLLSMMYLVFMRNGSIPDHLAEFYEKAYDALYSIHDSLDKGVYHREFKCSELTEREFQCLFARFCFQSYFDEKYEFSEKEAQQYLCKSIKKLNLNQTKADAFISDLKNIVCMLLQEGETYRFSHRSFQTFFAAWYTAEMLSDEQQKKLFTKKIADKDMAGYFDYCILLYQIQPKRFEENVLKEKLREIQRHMDDSNDPCKWLAIQRYPILEYNMIHGVCWFGGITYISEKGDASSFRDYIELVRRIYTDDDRNRTELSQFVRKLVLEHKLQSAPNMSTLLKVSDIDINERLTDDEKNEFWKLINIAYGIPELYAAINRILSDFDKRDNSFDSDDFMDEL